MRFHCDIIFKNKVYLPTNFRIKIVSLIKEAINEIDPVLYANLWGTSLNVMKSFTFTTYIPNSKLIIKESNRCLEFTGNSIRLIVSCYDIELLNIIMRGFESLSNKHSILNSVVSFKNFRSESEILFLKDRVYDFKLIAPLIIRNISHGKFKGYLNLNDDDYKESIFYEVKTLSNYFLNQDLRIEDFDFGIISGRQIKIHHYKEIIPAVVGNIKLKAASEVLKLLYDSGIGARRSQGFGMLKII